jgi:hypothetical protein
MSNQRGSIEVTFDAQYVDSSFSASAWLTHRLPSGEIEVDLKGWYSLGLDALLSSPIRVLRLPSLQIGNLSLSNVVLVLRSFSVGPGGFRGRIAWVADGVSRI